MLQIFKKIKVLFFVTSIDIIYELIAPMKSKKRK